MSPSFNSSRYIQENELKRVLDRHAANEALVLPVFIRPVGAVELLPFDHIQGLPTDGRLKPVSEWSSQDAAWVQVTDYLGRVAAAREESTEDQAVAKISPAWILAEALAMFHVDLMRLFIVLFGTEAYAANRERVSEFVTAAKTQANATDGLIRTSGSEVSSYQLREATVLLNNMQKTLGALEHRRSQGQSAVILRDNLRSIAHRINSLLRQVDPQHHTDILAKVDEAFSQTILDLAESLEATDTIAYRRFALQETYLKLSSSLLSVVEDFDQSLAVPYFLIDVRLLRGQPA
ncbi:MAG: hypothetical protein AAF497_10620 [Planctomycetota bacterium]